MSAIVKSKLKAARDALGKKDYASARDAAQTALDYDADNYNANVFLGLALLELGEHAQSEEAYQRATKFNSDQPLAWQGLVKFYEQTQRWPEYAESLLKLMDVYAKTDDATKCGEILQKLIEFRRQHGTRLELVSALELLLPTSKFYSTLSLLPPPDPTAPTTTTTQVVQTAVHNTLPVLLEIVEIVEKNEREIVDNEIRKARTRLDSAAMTPEAVRRSVGTRVWSASKLPELYNEVISHPNTSDELRRETEAALLRYKHQLLCALPSPSSTTKTTKTDDRALENKRRILSEVRSMVDGMVLLDIPDELAWNFVVEGTDVDSVEGYNLDSLRRFMHLFPQSALTPAINGYFLYHNIPLGNEEEKSEGDEEDEKQEEAEDETDPFDVVLNAVADLPDSILAHRILVDIYLREEDFQNTIATAEKGLVLVRRLEADMGEQLLQVRKAFNIALAAALVHLFPPKHHTRAIRVLDDVLTLDPKNARALLARAYILQAAGRWTEAAELFLCVSEYLSDDIDLGVAAREERAWCLAEQHEHEVAIDELKSVLDRLKEVDAYEDRKARVCWRLGLCYWGLSESNRETSYKYYIAALKYAPGFAPAFSALGVYYVEAAEPHDPARAARCFQKAFELDAGQADAARRLASGFADEREWDLVEAVARRAIAGEGGLAGGLGLGEGDKEVTAAAARYKPTNAWAWKALGIVELNQRNYTAAIHSLQVALRADAEDANSWLRLGEAYGRAGRHAAALRALHKSLELAPDDWACEFHIAEVQRQTGLLPQAAAAFEHILAAAPPDALPPVLLSLAETQLALAQHERTTGFLARAPETFLSAIASTLELVNHGAQYKRSAWKIASDALLGLAEFDTFNDLDSVFGRLANLIGNRSSDEKLTGVLQYPLLRGAKESTQQNGSTARNLLVAMCASRLDLFKEGEDSAAGAWFDLGVSLVKRGVDLADETSRSKAQKEATECVRRALLAHPGNALFWSTFGNLNFESRPAVAQHAFIRSLEINNKDASVWSALGLLYLNNKDNMLANEAFLKAQTLDPDFTLAWVGQGLVAVSNGHLDDAAALFEHAISLTADLPEADVEYAQRSFLKLGKKAMRTQDELLVPFFALDRFCRRRPADASALHLLALVCERLKLDEPAMTAAKRAIDLLETAYEASEDPVLERRYAIAQATLGRLYLSQHNYSKSHDAFETALGLLPEVCLEGKGVDVLWTDIVALRTLCQFGSAIAKMHTGSFEEAVELAETAQQTAEGNAHARGQASVVLAQVLWEAGGDELREAAKEHLFECINNDPENLTAVTALAAMGLFTADETLIDAALSEITGLPLDARHERDPEREVDDLLADHYLAEGDLKRSASILQRAIHAEPAQLRPRIKLAELAFARRRYALAQALLEHLLDSSKAYTLKGTAEALRLLAIATANSSEGPIKDEGVQLARRAAQKAVVLAPWDKKNTIVLNYVLHIVQS